jgi:hypothetical protein
MDQTVLNMRAVANRNRSVSVDSLEVFVVSLGEMHKYRVVEHQAAEGRCALQCSMGRFHLVRVLAAMPPMGVRLGGDKPHLGFGILRCTASGEAFRVIFESINDLPRTRSSPDSARRFV